MVQAFWQLPLHPDSRQATAFTVHPLSKMEFKRVPMNWKLSITFMTTHMNRVMAGIEFSSCICYVDDVLVHSKGSAEGHLKCLTRVLNRLHKAGNTLHIKKMLLFEARSCLLGVLSLLGWVSSQSRTR